MAAPQLTAQIQGQGSVNADQMNTWIQGCDSVSQLRVLTGLPGMEVDIRGLTTAGDGGAGRFYWNASSMAIDDGLNVIVPSGASSGAWLRLWNSPNPTVSTTFSYQRPLDGFAIQFPAATALLYLDPASTLATGTVTTPTTPVDGQSMTIATSATITAFTLSASAGQLINVLPTTLLVGVPLSYIYRLASTTWELLGGIIPAPAPSGTAGISPPQGRLTLAGGTPVMTTTIAGGNTIYYTAYVGRNVPIWNGSAFVQIDLGGDISQATTDAAHSPAACAANSTYDLFVWLNGSTPTLSRGPAWSSATVRACALTRTDGFWTNASAITNGPAIGYGTWVGTIQTNGFSTVDFIFGTAASGGGISTLNVWNYYNRVSVGTSVVDSGATYTYASATIRQARASATNQINFVVGLIEDSIDVTAINTSPNASGSVASVGVGLNSITAFVSTPANSFYGGAMLSRSIVLPTLGSNYVAALEQSPAAASLTFCQLAPIGASLSAVLSM